MSQPTIADFSAIPGVQLVQLNALGDGRGRFTEIFRKEWFPQRAWDCLQSNRSDSAAGVLRGLHYHFQQIDYWYLLAGEIRVGLVDLRRSSATPGSAATIDMRADEHRGIYIPAGVAHGFLALSDVTLLYFVDNYYDGGGDEFGLAWDDPDVAVAWQVPHPPILSGRDARNPRLKDIPESMLPG